MKNKKILLLILGFLVILFLTIFAYFRIYQTLPKFAVSLIPEAEIPGQGKTVLVIVPHEDDEVLGAGGFIEKSIKNGANVMVIFLTNGGGHKFTTQEESRKLYPKPENYIESGYQRQQEAKKALAILGLPENKIIFMGYPDNGLKNLFEENFSEPYLSPYTKQNYCSYSNCYHKEAPYTGENLQNDLEQIIKTYFPDLILTTHPSDTHSDHSYCADFVANAIETNPTQPELYYFIIHFNRFPYPKGLHINRYLTPPGRLISSSDEWLKTSLDSDTLELKKQALEQYQSQFASPMLKSLMEGFLRKNEIFSKAKKR